MRSKGTFISFISIASTGVLLCACGLFEYSPFTVPAAGDESGLTAIHLERIARTDGAGQKSFEFAVLADVQGSYDQLSAAVERINSDTSIDFVVVAGDLTQLGYRKEYRWCTGILAGLVPPYLMVIGNHDIQSNGMEIYRRMFGPLDFSFHYRGVKFVFYNDNAREFPCCVPDFTWLERELGEGGDSLRKIAVSHCPPFGDQLNKASSKTLTEIYSRNWVVLSIHGHLHRAVSPGISGHHVSYLVVDNAGDWNYSKVAVTETGFSVERVFLR